MPTHMTTLVQSIMPPNVTVFSVKPTIKDDGSIYNLVDEWLDDLVRLIQYFKWEKVVLLDTTKYEFPFQIFYKKTVEKLRQFNVCIDLFHHQGQTNALPEELASFLSSGEKIPVIFFGNGEEQVDVLRSLVKYKLLPYLSITHDALVLLDLYADPIKPFLIDVQRKDRLMDAGARYKNFKTYLLMEYNLERFHMLPQYVIFSLERIFLEILAIHNAYAIYWGEKNVQPSYFNQIYHRWLKRPSENINPKTIYKSRDPDAFFPEFGEIDILNPDDRHNFFKVKQSICHKPTCRAGHHRVYGNVTNGYAWKCVLCPEDTHKRLSGDGNCMKCTGRFSIDNGKRTSCIDPYTNKSISMENEEFVFLVALSISGLLLTIFSMFVFVAKRKTPIVLVSDFLLSMIHISIIGLLFVAMTVSFLGEPKFYKCLLRLLSFSLLYTTNIGIIFVKSQKILVAFSSQTRLTPEEVKQTKTLQIFTMIVFLISANSIFAISINQQPLMNIETFNEDSMTSFHHCNNSFHFNVLIACTMVIQLMCSIQAFRGRNLPSVMNDGIVLMYATFTLTIVFGISFVIVNAQSPHMKELFQCIAITINNVVIVFLMYTQKALRMSIFPEKNTREYFQKERMRERKQNIDETVQRR